MRPLPTRIDGLVLVAPDVHQDERGFFVETFHAAQYLGCGIGVEFVQDNHSRSLGGVVRGLHYQVSPGQAKLVRVARGRIFDVVVDIRLGSPTFGQYEAFLLDDEAHHQLFIPIGFAHGFATLTEETDVVYKVSAYYDPATERGLAWDDPELAIPWPLTDPVVSARDRANPPLRSLRLHGHGG